MDFKSNSSQASVQGEGQSQPTKSVKFSARNLFKSDKQQPTSGPYAKDLLSEEADYEVLSKESVEIDRLRLIELLRRLLHSHGDKAILS